MKKDVSYIKLWKLLIDKSMTKTELRLKADLATTTLARLGKAQPVTMEVMLTLIRAKL
ncbi:MAG: helix-turn-helix transcriptional regulator [Christensenellaceae bacterium]|nr:helix-turn-helix transcriptional regulator [Christensenellaceae bacterium]